MLLQRLNRLILLLCGKMGIDVHGHRRIGVAEKVLGCLHIHPGVIKHGSVGVPKLMGGEPVHSDDFGIAVAGVPAPCLNVQIVHIGVPGGGPRRIGHHGAVSGRADIQGIVAPSLSENGQKLSRKRNDSVARRRLGPLDLRLVLPESGSLGAKFGSILSTFFRDQRTSFLPV